MVRYERRVWAPDEASAVAIVNEGTAWPQSHDEIDDEIVDGAPSVVEITDPNTLKLWRDEDPEFEGEGETLVRDSDGVSW